MTIKYAATLSVTAFIEHKGKALIAKRSADDSYLPGYWEQVGGKVDEGESSEDAIIREVKEEAGIDVAPVFLYSEFEYAHHRDGRAMCEYAYVCKLKSDPKIKLSFEHQEYVWVSLEDLITIKPMTDIMREVIRKGFEAGKS